MSARRPDLGEIDDRAEERLLSGRPVDDEPALSAFVGELLASAQDAPAPSAALADLLDNGLDPVTVPLDVPTAALPVVPGRRRFLPVWSRAALAAAAALVLVLSAAAIGALPGTAQNAVADVVGWVTPLDLPHEDDPAGPVPVVSPTPSETPEVEPGDDKGGAGAVENSDDSGGHGSDDSSGSGSGSDDSSGSGSGSDDSSGSGSSGSGSDDSSGSSGSGSSGSGSSGSDSSGSGSDGSDDSSSGSSSSGSGSSGSGSSGSGGSDDKPSPTPTPSPTKTSDDH